MPELPEVETVVRGLRRSMVGARIEDVVLNRTDLRWPIPSEVRHLVGQQIRDVQRYAKTVIVIGEHGDGWLLHLGMSGRLSVIKTQNHQADKHDHVLILLADNQMLSTLVFQDPRRFGFFDYSPNVELLNEHPRLKSFGIDPTTQALSPQWLYDQTRNRKSSLKAFLMDQKFIAGLGNIYVSEALHRTGLHPMLAAGSIGSADCDALVLQIKETLLDAIDAGGSSLRDYVQTDGKLGFFQHQWQVYAQAGQRCQRCNQGEIQRIVQQQRSSYFCPVCQPAPSQSLSSSG